MKTNSKNKIGWLVNDTLTCIPGTKTFWHNLLEWIPGLVDQTGGYTQFSEIPKVIERKAREDGPPDYIIRNGTFFRKMNINTKTISLLQDCYTGNQQQIYVANTSDVVVFNSPFTKTFFDGRITTKMVTIPLGVNSDFFDVGTDHSKELGILQNSILFVGANNAHPKGFDLMMNIINNTNHNFCLVMKDNFSINHPRVKVFNKITQEQIKKVYNSCKLILCTSRIETQHLVGIEAGFCGLPIITTNVGVYYGLENGEWGRRANTLEEFKNEIEYVLNNYNKFDPRNYFLNNGYDTNSCKNKWINLINEING